VGVTNPGDIPPSASNWGIVAATVVAAMPHLWQWLGGHQKARNTLTETLLQKLTDSYQLASISNEAFREMIEKIAERPTEIAEGNSQALSDLLDEVADLRGQIVELNKRSERLASMITREAQNR
jgi:two-component SAPR family response regulator